MSKARAVRPTRVHRSLACRDGVPKGLIGSIQHDHRVGVYLRHNCTVTSPTTLYPSTIAVMYGPEL